MSKTLQLLFILLFIHCFTSKRILAELTRIPITDNSSPSERVIQSAIYQDDTILLRLVNETNGCQIKLKLIHQDGTIDTLIINNDDCIPPTNPEFVGDDGIRIYSLNPQYILLTYFCKIEQETTECGRLINWNNDPLSEISFEQPCNTSSSIVVQNLIDGDGEFLRVCYQQGQINWTRYTIVKNNQTINAQDHGIISNVNIIVDPFPLSKHLFPTAGGGYGIVANQSINPQDPGALYVNFISPLPYVNDNVNGPFQLYTTSENTITSNVYKCGISYVDIGYNCITSLDLGLNTFVNINFLDSGSTLSTNEFKLNPNPNIIGVDLLYYGGFIVLSRDPFNAINGSVYFNNGTYCGDWGMQTTIGEINNINYTNIFGVFTNNTIWSIGNSDQGVQLITNDLSYMGYSNIDDNTMIRIENFGNPFIEWVTIGDRNYTNFTGIISIPTTLDSSNISIKFVNLIELSNGNISIWQSWENNQITLRQSFSGVQSQFVQLYNDMTVNITLFESTFNIPSGQYYIKIDPGFVKDLRTGQNLVGIGKNRWSFITETDVQDTGTGSVSTLMRLTPEGTKNFKLNDRESFISNITKELTRLIPIHPSRLSTRKHFQFDPSVQEDQILLRIDVKVADDNGLVGMVNSERVVRDLDTLIRNKDFTGIGMGEFTNTLDSTYGSESIPDLWNRYRWILIGVAVAIIILLILFYLARRSTKGRNYMVFIFVIIIIDFGLDIAFVVIHGHDLEWLYPTSVVFLAFPILVNTIVTIVIIAKETASKDNEFADWWKRNSKIALFFTLFSIIDIEGLNIISSGYAGYDRFNAPISDRSFTGIIFASAVVKFLEDIPQLIIYVLYQTTTVVPAIIPILALSSCCFVIGVKSAIVVGFCIYRRPPRSYYSIRREKMKKLTEGSEPYKPPSPKQPFVEDRTGTPDGTLPDGADVQTTDQGIKFTMRPESESIKNLPVKTVGKPVLHSIVNVEEGTGGRTGEERLSDQGIIGSTENGQGVIGSTEDGDKHQSIVESENGDRQESIEVLDPGDPGGTGGSVIQGPSGGYQSRLIEKIDIDPESEESPPQEQEIPQPPPQSSSSLGAFVRRLGWKRDSQKGKAKDDDDKKKKDDG